MPLYDLMCESKDCGMVQERIVPYEGRNEQVCVCGANMKVVWTKGHVFIPFKPRRFNGTAGPDVMVESKKQLKQLCKDNDCSSVYLMDN